MKTLVRRYFIEADPKDVMKALTNRDYIEEWTNDIAEFDPRPNGKFSLWDGSIIGKNKEITEDKIVQDWKEETWDAYTRVTIRLHNENGNTRVELIHKDIPNEAFSNIADGWDRYYFYPLKDFVEEGFD